MKYLFMQEYILWEIRVENVTCKNYSMHFHRKIYTMANSQIYLCNPFIVKKRVMWCCKLYLAVWKVICTCTLILVFFPDMYTYSLCMIIEEVSVTVSVSPVFALFYNNRKYEFVNQKKISWNIIYAGTWWLIMKWCQIRSLMNLYIT